MRAQGHGLVRAALLGLVAAAAVGQAVDIPEGYEIVQITNGPEYDHDPRMNSRGQIVFTRQAIPGNNSTMEIMLWDNGKLIQLTDDSCWDGSPDINNHGVVTWSRADQAATKTDIVVLRDGQLIRLTDGGWNGLPRINDAGHIVWNTQTDGGCAGLVKDLCLFDGQTVRQITSNGVADDVINNFPNINESGQIVWTEYDFCDPPPFYRWTSRVMMWENGQTRVLTMGQPGAQAANINNRTQVVWEFDVEATDHLMLWDNGKASVLAQGSMARINDRTHVPFLRWNELAESWEQWLFRDGTFYLVDPDYGVNGEINERSEMVWQVHTAGVLTDDLRMMRLMDVPGDMDCDGIVTTADIVGFVDALVSPSRYEAAFPYCDRGRGDVNHDGIMDAFDVEPFVNLLLPW